MPRRLERWGLRTLGELAALPARELFERLGAEGPRLQALARGEDAGPLSPWRPPRRFEETRELDWAADNLEPLFALFAELADRVCARLEGEALAADLFEWSCRVTAARGPGREVHGSFVPPVPCNEMTTGDLPVAAVDGQDGIHDPLGMTAGRLEANVHIVTGARTHNQNVLTAVNKAGVHVDDTVFEPLACADSVLRADERELGICLADLGAGSCDLIVFQQGAVAHTAVIPIGGDHFTCDLSVGMCTGLAESESLKKNFGNAVATLIPEGNEVEVPSVGDRPSRLMPQRMVGEILEPRARELFEMLRENLRQAGVLNHCIAGFVLSGGASRLPGILDVAESVLRKASRLAWPTPMAKMPALLAEPECSTVLGMVYYGHRARIARGLQDGGWSSRMKAMFAKKGA